jgi:heavy-metal resistance protein
MLGIIIGTLCLVGFVAVWRRRGWRGYAHFGHHRRRFGRSGLYRLFQELDTSPGQEKAIRSAIGQLRGSLGDLRPNLDAARGQLASAVRDERFDASTLQAALENQTRELGAALAALAESLGKVHEALDPDQRRRLARFIEVGPGYSCG